MTGHRPHLVVEDARADVAEVALREDEADVPLDVRQQPVSDGRHELGNEETRVRGTPGHPPLGEGGTRKGNTS